MGFPFNTPKGTDAAARFAELAGGSINVLKLSKLAYLLDRMAIERRGIPVMGGAYYSMKDGPMISEILDLINRGRLHPKKPTLWERIIHPRNVHDVAVTGVEMPTSLSNEEITFIDELWKVHGRKGKWELRDWCHKHCPEYSEIKAGRKPIPLVEIANALNVTPEDAKWLEDEAKAENQLQAIFG
jgi:hypothetical protein